MLNDICNFRAISDTLATAGQPTAAQFADIRDAGYTVVINLALPTSTNALADERAIVEGHNMTYYPIPVIWEAPATADFQEFQAALAQHAGQKVFVHCAMNLRVSAFVYLYRRQAGVPKDLAGKDLHAIWQPNATWQQFIDDMS